MRASFGLPASSHPMTDLARSIQKAVMVNRLPITSTNISDNCIITGSIGCLSLAIFPSLSRYETSPGGTHWGKCPEEVSVRLFCCAFHAHTLPYLGSKSNTKSKPGENRLRTCDISLQGTILRKNKKVFAFRLIVEYSINTSSVA